MEPNLANDLGSGSQFPPTIWALLDQIRAAPDQTHRNTLEQIIRVSWKPVYGFVRRLGHSEADAEDITQGFFAHCLCRGLFSKAKPERGRFRTFLLRSLNNYIHNLHRAGQALRRQPEGGSVVSLDELREAETGGFEPRDQSTPEAAFNRAWAVGLVRTVLKLFKAECEATAKQAHCAILFDRIIRPNLEGSQPTPFAELGTRFGLTEKQAANCLGTARLAFQRILREQLAPCAGSESEIEAEVADLFALLGQPPSETLGISLD